MSAPSNVCEILRLIEEKQVSPEQGLAILKSLRCNSGPAINAQAALNELSVNAGARSSESASESGTPNPDPDRLEEMLSADLTDGVARILQIHQSDIDPDEDMSKYGFDSITLTEMAAALNRKYALDLTPDIFFEYLSIAEFARYMMTAHYDAVWRYFNNLRPDAKALPANAAGPAIEIPAAAGETSRIVAQALHCESPASRRKEPIAIIGMAGIMPGAHDLEEFWRCLEAGSDLVTEIPAERWDWKAYWGDPTKTPDKTNVKWGGFIRDVDKFDAKFFGTSPREAELMDPQHRLFLEVVWQCIENAGYKPSDLSGTPTAVMAGIVTSDYSDLLNARVEKGIIPIEAYMATGINESLLSNRVSFLLNLTGPSESINTACSSSLVAVHRCVELLRSGRCDMALAGGVNLLLNPTIYISLSKTGMLSPDGRCKAFDHRADGYVRGEGCAAVLLKPLWRAREDGDHIHALILGSAENHGGHSASLTAPNPRTEADLLIRAYEDAGIDPVSVTFIETHGTGTALGDPIEINGLKKAFAHFASQRRDFLPSNPHCALGAVKTNIGHLEAAAGIAGLVKVVLAMKNRKIPANVHFEALNPHIRLSGTPFYVADCTVSWQRIEDAYGSLIPRRAGISSFGFGGAYTHVVLEEADADISLKPSLGLKTQDYVIVLSAQNEDRLKAYAERILQFLKKRSMTGEDADKRQQASSADLIDLQHIAYTLQVGREAMRTRLAMVVRNVSMLIEKLSRYLCGDKNIENLYFGRSKTRKKREPALSQDDEGTTHFASIIEAKKFDELAKLWTAGADIDWRLLYPEGTPVRIPLPTSPFEKKRYWIPEGPAVMEPSDDVIGTKRLHPLVHVNTSDLSELKFCTRMTGSEFFLCEHTFKGRKIMPATAYIEMARAAGKLAMAQEVRGLESITWQAPLICDDTDVEIAIRLQQTESDVTFEIYTIKEATNRLVHCRGRLTGDGSKAFDNLRVRIDDVQKKCTKTYDAVQCYELFRKQGFEYGSSFQRIEQLCCNQTEAIARLRESGDTECNAGFFLHPAIMDAALQTVMGLMMHAHKHTSLEYLPFAAGTVRIYDHPGRARFILSRMTESVGRSTDATPMFTMDLLDEQGKMLVQIEEFYAKKPMGTRSCVASTSSSGNSGQAAETLMARLVWEQAAEAAPADIVDLGNILVFDATGRLESDLRTQFAPKAGLDKKIIVVKPGKIFQPLGECIYEIHPEREAAFRRLLTALVQARQVPQCIVFIGAAENTGSNLEKLAEHMQKGVYALFYLIRETVRQAPGQLTRLLYGYFNPDGQILPHHAAMAGFLKSVQMEYPKLVCKTVEMQFATPVGEQKMEAHFEHGMQILAHELISGSANGVDVRYQDGQRWVRRLKEIVTTDLSSQPAYLLKPAGVYLITGGVGRLGLHLADYLYENMKARLVLCGRSELSLESRTALDQLIQKGSEVIYVPVDISEPQGAQRLVAAAKEKFRKIDGVFHAAGVIRDALIVKKTDEDLDQVFKPKVFGVVCLDEALKNEKLDLFVLFSSATSVIGNVGQVDYAYANGYLDSFAERRQQLCSQGQRFGKTLAINWGLWRQGGMQIDAHSLKWLENALGMIPMETSSGLDALSHALASDAHQLVVISGQRQKLLDFLKAAAEGSGPKKDTAGKKPADADKWASSTDFLPELLPDLINTIAKILKVDEREVDPEEDVSDYGLDSITITEFANQVNDLFDLEITPALLFEFSSLLEFAQFLISEHPDQLAQRYDHPAQEQVPIQASQIETETDKASVQQPVVAEHPPHYASSVTVTPQMAHGKKSSREPVAIIGMAGRMPQSKDLASFWRHLEAGHNLVSRIPPDRRALMRLNGNDDHDHELDSVLWGGFINAVDRFDAAFFYISPREARLMDPQQRILLETVWMAIEDAGYNPFNLSGTQTGVFVGVSNMDFYDLLKAGGTTDAAHATTGIAHSVLANRLSFFFDFHGPSQPVDTACSSSLVAICRAVDALNTGDCELAVAGGVNVILSPDWYRLFSDAGMLCSDGKCKTFDKAADGYVRGEGCAALLLKPLSRAEADGDSIYAVILGTAENHGGRTTSLTAPNPRAQADLIVNAYRKAGIDPSTVGFIEAHGTGTALGDPIEINGLKKAFEILYAQQQKEAAQKPHCALGSVKTNIGHLEAAAGIAGVVKVILSIMHQKIPANIHLKEINPYIDLSGSPFYFVTNTRQWESIRDANGRICPLRAGISSFGFGGANAHIVIEGYAKRRKTTTMPDVQQPSEPQPHLIVFSARNVQRLRSYALRCAEFIETGSCGWLSVEPDAYECLENWAFTLQTGREAMAARLAVVVSSLQELKEKLLRYLDGEDSVEGLFTGVAQKRQAYDFEQGQSAHEPNAPANKHLDNLEDLARHWVAGAAVDWKRLYRNRSPRRLALPTYPFEPARHWIDAPLKETADHRRPEPISKNSPVHDVETRQPAASLHSARLPEPKRTDTSSVQSGGSNHMIRLKMAQPSHTPQVSRPVPANGILGKIIVKLSKVLCTPISEKDQDIAFAEMGLDSILGVELVKDLGCDLGVDLKAADLYDYPTAGALARYLESQIACPASAENGSNSACPDETDSPDENGPITTNAQAPNMAYAIGSNAQAAIPLPKASEASSPRKKQSRTAIPENLNQSRQAYRDIAIIGMSGRFPGADDVHAFWENLKNGIDSVTEVPPQRWDWKAYYHPDPKMPGKTYCKWGGFIPDHDKFDPLFFRISPVDAEVMDPQQRLALQESFRALENAGYTSSALSGCKCGVYVGVVNNNEYSELISRCKSEGGQGQLMLGNSNSVLAARISYFLNLKGPALTIDTACSSSLVAIHLACKELQAGETEMMLAGGVLVGANERRFTLVSMTGALSHSGRCRPFDSRADGYVPGEAVGIVVLKLLSKALADGDYIYGVIIGSGANQDGATNGITAPSVESQKQLALEVYTRHKINPETITYVEAHGTGTRLGDPIEVKALTEAFRAFTDKKKFCALGAVKSNIGHGSAAAGVTGLIKVLLALANRQLPACLHFKQPNEHIDFDNSPFYVNSVLQDWPSCAEQPRRAAISSFGLSGTNAHLVVEEAPPRPERTHASRPYYLIPLSAKTSEALKRRISELGVWLEHTNFKSPLDDLARTLAMGRDHFAQRAAFVVQSAADLKGKIRMVCDQGHCTDYWQTERDSNVGASVAEQQAKGDAVVDTWTIRNPSDAEAYRVSLVDLASHYVRGHDPDWSALYPDADWQRIPLPAYPFARELYWVNSVTVVSEAKIDVSLHPLLDRNMSTLSGIRFGKRLMGNEFYLADHVIGGMKLFPAVACIEMACIAGELAREKPVSKLKNLIWAQPIAVHEVPVDVEIRLNPSHSGLEFEVGVAKGNGCQGFVHSQGLILFDDFESNSDPPAHLDLAAIKSRCIRRLPPSECYRRYADRGVLYGASFQSIRDLYAGSREALAELVLHLDLREGSRRFRLHPTFLDGALQTIIGLRDESEDDDRKLFMPFVLGEVQIFGRLPETCFAYATPKILPNAANDQVMRFQILLADPSGSVKVKLDNFSIRTARDLQAMPDHAFHHSQLNSSTIISDEELKTLLNRLASNDLSVAEAQRMMEGIL